MNKLTCVLLAFSVFLTACASTKGGANTEATKQILDMMTPADKESNIVVQKEGSPSDKTAKEGSILADGVVIQLQRSGGFAGIDKSWSFYADGTIISNQGDQKTVTADRMASMIEALKASGFFEMENPSGGAMLSNCKDCFTYELIAKTGERVNTITVIEGATGASDALLTIIKQLLELAKN